MTTLVDILEMSEEEIDGFRSSPVWPLRLAAATDDPEGAPRPGELGLTAGQFNDQGADAAPVGIGQRPGDRRGDATGGARRLECPIHVLEGHGHFAHCTDPELVRKVIGRDFTS